MKAIKLILIFILLLGAIVGALFLSGSGGEDSIQGTDSAVFAQQKNKINREWNVINTWDWETYENCVSRLNQYKKELGSGYNTLVEMLGNRAVNKLDSVMINELAKADCDKAIIDNCGEGIKKLKAQSDELKTDQKLGKLDKIYKLYKKAYALATNSVGLSPRFSMPSSWADFTAYKNGKTSERSSIYSDANYSYIRNINVIKDGLTNLDKKLADAKETFKNKLAKEIIDAYSACGDEINVKDLIAAQSRFATELGRNSTLDTFVRSVR